MISASIAQGSLSGAICTPKNPPGFAHSDWLNVILVALTPVSASLAEKATVIKALPLLISTDSSEIVKIVDFIDEVIQNHHDENVIKDVRFRVNSLMSGKKLFNF